MISENNLQLTLLIIFSLLLINYLFFLFKVLSGLKKLVQQKNSKIPADSVSIIIPFRNEEEKILMNLKSIEAQDFPIDKYEVVYVDDSSADNSLKILNENISARNIKVLSVPKSFSPSAHKKRAIYG